VLYTKHISSGRNTSHFSDELVINTYDSNLPTKLWMIHDVLYCGMWMI